MTRASILVVDDNSTTRKLFRLALETEGYGVREVASGGAAIAAVSDSDIGLVLLDCRLPDLSGPEVAREIRERAPALPIVAVTGWAQTDEKTMLTAGFSEVLVKPVAPSRLVETVEQHLGGLHPRPGPDRGERALVIDDDEAQR